MKKLINSAETVLEESLDGFAAAHADILLLGAERKFVRRRTLKSGKVALISGGGSGHAPTPVLGDLYSAVQVCWRSLSHCLKVARRYRIIPGPSLS